MRGCGATGDGVLTKEEFRKGYALLTSDSQLAQAERLKVEAAVESARVEAVKEAARNLAGAELMDVVYGNTPGMFPAQYQPVAARKSRKPKQSGSVLRKPPKPPLDSMTLSERARLQPTNKLERKRKAPRLRGNPLITE
jgi:hypothetical protein